MKEQNDLIVKIVDDFFNYRLSQGWSLRQAARLLGCDHGYLYRIESGEKNASDTIIVKMIKIMGIRKFK